MVTDTKVDYAGVDHHARITQAAEEVYKARTQNLGGTLTTWAEDGLERALVDARNGGAGINSHQVRAALDNAITAGDPAIFRTHMAELKAPASAAAAQTVAHAAPIVEEIAHAAPVAEEVAHAAPAAARAGLGRRLLGGLGNVVRDIKSGVGEAISLRPVPRDTSVNMREPRTLRASELDAPLPTAMKHSVDHQPPLSRADALAQEAVATMPAADLAALKANPELLPDPAKVLGRSRAAELQEAPKVVGRFTQRLRGQALGSALAVSEITPRPLNSFGEPTWHGTALEPAAHRLHLENRTPPALPDGFTVAPRMSTIATPVATAAPEVAHVADPVAVDSSMVRISAQDKAARRAAVVEARTARLNRPAGKGFSALSVAETNAKASIAAPAEHAAAVAEHVAEVAEHAVEAAEAAAKPEKFGTRLLNGFKKLWPFGKDSAVPAGESKIKALDLRNGDVIAAEAAGEAVHAVPRGNGGIILPEIGKVAQETKGRPLLVAAGALAAVGGAAWLASDGKHQNREYQRRLDAAAMAPEQGI